eukprot:772163-Rhodomonas_salina.1
MNERIGSMCSTNQAETTHYSIFAASAGDSNGKRVPFTSVAFAVKNGRKPLFLEVQCCFAGNTVIHEGHPQTGSHCMLLAKTGQFIPY